MTYRPSPKDDPYHGCRVVWTVLLTLFVVAVFTLLDTLTAMERGEAFFGAFCCAAFWAVLTWISTSGFWTTGQRS